MAEACRAHVMRRSISAVIPTYNCVRYLPACLDSVLAQTLQPDEIIVVDDGSTDGTREMLQQRYPQVRRIRQANAGASAARNTGIEAAHCDIIAFGDADDLWHPRRLEHQLNELRARPDADLVGCVMQGIDAHAEEPEWPTVETTTSLEVDTELVLRWGGAIPLQTWLIKRNVFDAVGGLDTALPVAEDFEILLRVVTRGYAAISLREKLYAYRRRPDSLSATSSALLCHIALPSAAEVRARAGEC